MADATVDVRKGGRLRIHVTNLSASNNTFKILAGMRIEYAYLINTSASTWNNSLDLKMDGTTSILSVSPLPFKFTAINQFYELTPFINIDFFSMIADQSLTVSTLDLGDLSKIKLILGLETIL